MRFIEGTRFCEVCHLEVDSGEEEWHQEHFECKCGDLWPFEWGCGVCGFNPPSLEQKTLIGDFS